MKRNFIKKENPRQLLAAPPPPPCPVLFWSPVVVKESTDQWWVFFLMFSTEEAWWFGALEAKLNHHYPQKTQIVACTRAIGWGLAVVCNWIWQSCVPCLFGRLCCVVPRCLPWHWAGMLALLLEVGGSRHSFGMGKMGRAGEIGVLYGVFFRCKKQ